MTSEEAKKTTTEQYEALEKASRQWPNMSGTDAMLSALAVIGSHTLMTNLILVEILAELESARIAGR